MLLHKDKHRLNAKEQAPEEHTSEVEDPKLTNSSSSDLEDSPSPGVSDRLRLDGILTGGGGGTIGKKNFSKSKEPSSPFSIISSLRADSASEKPFLLKKSSTASTSETAMNAKSQKWGIKGVEKGRSGNYDMVQGLHASMRKERSESFSSPLCCF
jgi:hypothetical protein